MPTILLEPLDAGHVKLKRQMLGWIVAVCLAFVPVWHFTTRVYRAEVPVEDIRAWRRPGALDLRLNVQVDVYVSPELSLSAPFGSDIETRVNRIYQYFLAEKRMDGRSKILFEFGVSVAPMSKEAHRSPGQTWSGIYNSTINGTSYSLYLECNKDETTEIHIGEHRAAYISLRDCSPDTALKTTSKIIAALFAQEQSRYLDLDTKRATDDRDRHQMKTMKFEEDYQVIFSLLNGNPSDTLVTWDIDGAVHTYLDPFVQSVSSINKLSISSQVAFVLLRAKTDHSTVTKQIQNYAELPIKEQTMLLNDEPIQVIKQESLPLFVNSAEWNLAPAVSVSPPINLVLYVPAKKSRPLHLLKHNGALSGTNSFLIHRWGGISVQNLPLGYDGLSYHFGTQEMKPVMELFVSQLRGLMGIRETTIYNSAELFPGAFLDIAQSPSKGLTLWELDRLSRERTVENMLNAISTLNSLATLITNLESMVVLDHIRDKAKEALHNHEDELASKMAREALHSAETAFFDKTMVSLLYFPSEHIFAMYMPFFVPSAIPIFAAVIEQLKMWKAARKLKVS